MLPLAPLLSQRTISQVLLKHLAKLQARLVSCSTMCTWTLRPLCCKPRMQIDSRTTRALEVCSNVTWRPAFK
jgi:hypothetical protein